MTLQPRIPIHEHSKYSRLIDGKHGCDFCKEDRSKVMMACEECPKDKPKLMCMHCFAVDKRYHENQKRVASQGYERTMAGLRDANVGFRNPPQRLKIQRRETGLHDRPRSLIRIAPASKVVSKSQAQQEHHIVQASRVVKQRGGSERRSQSRAVPNARATTVRADTEAADTLMGLKGSISQTADQAKQAEKPDTVPSSPQSMTVGKARAQSANFEKGTGDAIDLTRDEADDQIHRPPRFLLPPFRSNAWMPNGSLVPMLDRALLRDGTSVPSINSVR